MRVTITGVQKKGSPVAVEFETAFGRGQALWQGRADPQMAGIYYVEVAVEDLLIWGADIFVCDVPEYRVDYQDDTLILQGKLESVEADGSAVLRIGESVLLLETKGGTAEAGSFVRVLANRVTLFDTDI